MNPAWYAFLGALTAAAATLAVLAARARRLTVLLRAEAALVRAQTADLARRPGRAPDHTPPG